MNGFIIIISAMLVMSFLSVICNQQSLQKAIAQNTTMMGNKTIANADTLMTKIRNMGNVTSGNGSGSNSSVNMTNASTPSDMVIGNKSS